MYPLLSFSGLGQPLVTRFAASFIHMMASRGPSSAQHGPAPTLVCHPECAPARSLAQGKAHAASAPHGLGNVRATSFFLELQDAIEHVWEEWTPTAGVRGVIHSGGNAPAHALSVLPGQPGELPPVRTHGGSAPQERRHGVHPQSHAYSPRPEGRPPSPGLFPAPAHPATCPLPNHLLPDIGNKTR